MYDVSILWGNLIADPNHWFETKVVIAGTTYEQDKIMSMSAESRMFSGQQPGVGGCLSGELKLKMLAPSSAVPRMALIEPYVRVTNGTQTAEWIPQGKYYVDTRETTKNDDGLPVLSLHAYDAMLKSEAEFPPVSHDFPATDATVINDIASTLGVGVDDRTWETVNMDYSVYAPLGYTMREVLSNIGAMYGGNWYMTYDGELILAAVNGIPRETNYLVDNVGDAITFGGDRILV